MSSCRRSRVAAGAAEVAKQRLGGRDFLVAGRLTLADVSVGYPLHLIAVFGIDVPLGTRTAAYRERLRTRPAFIRAAAIK